MKALTRREFLELAATRSVAAGIAANALLSACRSTADRPSALGLDTSATKTLIAFIDEIIPPGDAAAALLASVPVRAYARARFLPSKYPPALPTATRFRKETLDALRLVRDFPNGWQSSSLIRLEQRNHLYSSAGFDLTCDRFQFAIDLPK